jgi:plasmid stabilization system protein ParE
MTYKLNVARRAEQDRDETFEWYQENYSEAFAVRWYVGISKAIGTVSFSLDLPR